MSGRLGTDPGDSAFLRWGILAGALLFGACIAGYFLSLHYSIANDDAYISFKYASNLAGGDGLVFNKGERIWGFTSPLQTLLLAAFMRFGAEPAATSFCLTVVWIALTSWVVFLLVKGISGSLAGLLVCLYFLTFGAGLEISGLESSLLVFLQSLFLLLFMSGRHRSGAVVAGLACLTRPDAILLAVPVILLTRKGRKAGTILAFLLPCLLWTAFAWGYYGELLPNTFWAKRDLVPFRWNILQAVTRLTAVSLPPGFPGISLMPSSLRALGAWIAPWLGVLLSFAPLLDRRIRRHPALGYALTIYPWVLILAYGLIRSLPDHTWEVYSAYFFFRMAVLVGLVSCLGIILPRRFETARPMTVVRLAVASAVTVSLLLVIALNGRRCFERLDRLEFSFWDGGRRRDYLVISGWFNRHLPRGASVGLLEIGTIGYYTDIRVVDMCGLVTKGYKPKNIFDYQSFIRRFEPDGVLVHGRLDYLPLDGDIGYRRTAFFPMGHYRSFSLLWKTHQGP